MRIRMIYMAAGNSRRFGSNKLFYPIDGKPMYRHVLERLAAICERHSDWEIVLVSQYEELYENIQYSPKGQLRNNSLMQYKVPTRLDMGKLRVEFESSYEPTGPFGAKSIGEIVINTPSPALAHAIYNATGLWFRELPITSEKIAMGLLKK